ncbi:MAG: hypothetical protein CM1200mP14_25190 [Gammaproteobacteria bacterium]|nr:MAG: hypothetical protein CM1200mP14_25190 [Gammaproteobacteria bacterium]
MSLFGLVLDPFTGFFSVIRWMEPRLARRQRSNRLHAYRSVLRDDDVDSEPGLIRGNILQRGGWIDKDDNIRIALDTYDDDTNAYMFEVGVLGTQDDALISDESSTDWNWDGFTRPRRGLRMKDGF